MTPSSHPRPAPSPDRETRCPGCGAEGGSIGRSRQAPVYRCRQCGLCFLGASLRGNAALDNAWYGSLEGCPPEWAEAFKRQMGGAYGRQLARLEKLVPGRSLLDVGAGIGVFLAVARDRGWRVKGTEESPHAGAFAERHYGIRLERSLASLPKGAFDVIRLSHVLEHIPEPEGFFEAVLPLLAPGGILAVIVPNREPLCAMTVNRLRRLFDRDPRLAGAIYPHMHVLGFSPRSLEALLVRAGLAKESTFTVSMGNREYFPMFYDGLLNIRRDIPFGQLLRYWLPMWVDNLGNAFGRGQWIVALFRKPRDD